jgi:hypothetical protein
MPQNLKSRLGLRTFLAVTLLCTTGHRVASASDEIPTGYQSDRYHSVWERNPFTLVTLVAGPVQPKIFDKLILLSWLNEGDKDVIFVQNTETNEVEKVATEPNASSLRLLTIHKDPDPGKVMVVLSNGKEQGSVKFRTDSAVVSGQNQVGGAAGAPGSVVPNQGAQVPPRGPRQIQRFRGPQPVTGGRVPQQAVPQQAVQQPAVPQLPEATQLPQTPATTTMAAPRASEVRRKRITAPPVDEQPVDGPTPVEDASTQPQTQ